MPIDYLALYAADARFFERLGIVLVLVQTFGNAVKLGVELVQPFVKLRLSRFPEVEVGVEPFSPVDERIEQNETTMNITSAIGIPKSIKLITPHKLVGAAAVGMNGKQLL